MLTYKHENFDLMYDAPNIHDNRLLKDFEVENLKFPLAIRLMLFDGSIILLFLDRQKVYVLDEISQNFEYAVDNYAYFSCFRSCKHQIFQGKIHIFRQLAQNFKVKEVYKITIIFNRDKSTNIFFKNIEFND